MIDDEVKKGRGAPQKSDEDKLQPRFTLNLNDEQNQIFEDAVKLTGKKRSSFARDAVVQASIQAIKYPNKINTDTH